MSSTVDAKREYSSLPVFALLALLAGWAVWMGSQYGVAEFNNDTAQYISSARSIQAGQGFKTSVIYYEQQHQLPLPAPQTVWPPGFPASIAALAQTGVPFEIAAFSLAAVSNLMIALLLFVGVRSISGGRWAGVVAAGVWLLLFHANYVVRQAGSEPLFMAASLGAILVAVRAAANADPRREMWLWFYASLLAAAAFLVRYNGIALVGAVGLVPFARLLQRRDGASLRALLAATVVPVAIVTAVFARNYGLIGSIFGGPRVHRDSRLPDALLTVWWSIKNSLGIYDSDALSRLVLVVLLVGGLAWLIAALPALYRNASSALRIPPAKDGAGQSDPMMFATLIAGAFALATIAIFVQYALQVSAEVVVPRYWVPIQLCAVFLIALWTPTLARATARRRLPAVSCGLLIVGIVAAQFIAMSRDARADTEDTYNRTVISALGQVIDGQTMREHIRALTKDGSSVLEPEGQFVGMLLDRPTVGLPRAIYSSTTWNEPVVRELVLRKNISVVCLMPGTFLANTLSGANKPFFANLAAGRVPDWLHLSVDSPSMRVFVVDREKLQRRTQSGQ